MHRVAVLQFFKRLTYRTKATVWIDWKGEVHNLFQKKRYLKKMSTRMRNTVISKAWSSWMRMTRRLATNGIFSTRLVCASRTLVSAQHGHSGWTPLLQFHSQQVRRVEVTDRLFERWNSLRIRRMCMSVLTVNHKIIRCTYQSHVLHYFCIALILAKKPYSPQ